MTERVAAVASVFSQVRTTEINVKVILDNEQVCIVQVHTESRSCLCYL